ncbi:MAG TPA: arsenosugar biosynthesis radical SAM protein ArsS [Ignavibacteria bacterium]|nr:arsenosugar biosynthesis radical SAM protein ArsS [Ignavibacteria bacterium]
MLVKSLKFRDSELSIAGEQLNILNGYSDKAFSSYLKKSGIEKLTSRKVEIFQINIGKMCNQTCKHCHVDAGPDRKEIMTRKTMQIIIDKLKDTGIKTADITGGAPEMNPDFRWFVTELRKIDINTIVRCNLTIILANPKYNDLPDFFKENNIEVVSSLPYFQKSNTDRQRGDGVFDASVKALQMLNEKGYGKEGSDLILNLVYNPTGAFLPGSQKSLENDFKKELLNKHGIVFNNLFTITNMPISRFLEYLIDSGNYEYYMDKLIDSYNPSAAENVMCTNTISVGWDGYLYDCDFNQMLELKVENENKEHIRDFDLNYLDNREIITGQHCFGCTAGAGSSCGGAVA